MSKNKNIYVELTPSKNPKLPRKKITINILEYILLDFYPSKSMYFSKLDYKPHSLIMFASFNML